MSFVLDNSVALAWCFVDEQTAAVMALLDRTVASGATAPSLWPLEALNGLLVAERRGRVSEPQRRQLATFLHDLPITLDEDTAIQAWDATVKLAESFKLTIYDATYLELARRRRLPLATLDQQLLAAARTLGIDTLGVSA